MGTSFGNYNLLAEIYDELVASVDYDEWASYMEDIFREHNLNPRKITDLACGTGNTTIPLGRKGYEIIGVDVSPAMLQKANEKAASLNLNIKFYQQDMRELHLKEPQDVILSYHDGINYLTESSDLQRLFAKVYENLTPGGLFIFDLVNVDRLASASGDDTVLDEPERTLVWQTTYHEQQNTWEINLTGFIRQPSGLYQKFSETHREKFYPRTEVEECLEKARLKLLACYHPFTMQKVASVNDGTNRRRLFYVAQHEKR